MNSIALLLTLLLFVSASSVALGNKKFKPRGDSIPRHDFVQVKSSEGDAFHELIFAVKQRNLDQLDVVLMERSTPGSPLYQQWLSFEEVGQLTSNPDGAKAVEDWLAEHDIPVTSKTVHSDYIKATAKISQWEEMLDTKFFVFEDQSRVQSSQHQTHRTMHRATQYSLPEHLSEHLSTVFNTVQVPPVLKKSFPDSPAHEEAQSFKSDKHLHLRGMRPLSSNPAVTVAYLRDLYGIPALEGNASMEQAVFATDENYFSITDLAYFQGNYSLPTQTVEALYGFSTDSCDNKNCTEGNLDTQFISGVAPGIQTVYWYEDGESSDPFVTWATTAANKTNPPLVTVITYGAFEYYMGADVMTTFNAEAQKLAARGRTIIVSSGDNGVADLPEFCNYDSSSGSSWVGVPWQGKGYFPLFPATSPYVTVVGATMINTTSSVPNNEITCQSNEGSKITTGGGFSTVTETPYWQQSAVDLFLSKTTAKPGCNPNGRAYPDVALIGVNYQVYVQGKVTPLDGTSASAPVFAAMVSLVNSARATAGKGPVGFLNPTLYAFGGDATYFKDVDSGNNACLALTPGSADPECCPNSGFTATTGWDPLTGFGSITYNNLYDMFLNDLPPSLHDEDNSLTVAEISGIAVGGVAGISLLAGLYYCLTSRKKRPSKEWSTVREDLPSYEDTAL